MEGLIYLIYIVIGCFFSYILCSAFAGNLVTPPEPPSKERVLTEEELWRKYLSDSFNAK